MVTLNNDTIVVTPDWLEQMVSLTSLPDVGVVERASWTKTAGASTRAS